MDKALSLLRLVAERDMAGIGVSELARVGGVPKSTAFRLLSALERNGAVEKKGITYRIGSLVYGVRALPDSPDVDLIHTVLTPFLAHLFERTRQTVQLAILDGDEIVFLNKLHAVHRAPSPSRIGGRSPAHCTSLGKVLLAFDSDAVERVCAQPLVAWTNATITDPEELVAHLSGVRRRRIGTDDEEYVVGVGSLAAPIMRGGRAVASLAVTGPPEVLRGGV